MAAHASPGRPAAELTRRCLPACGVPARRRPPPATSGGQRSQGCFTWCRSAPGSCLQSCIGRRTEPPPALRARGRIAHPATDQARVAPAGGTARRSCCCPASTTRRRSTSGPPPPLPTDLVCPRPSLTIWSALVPPYRSGLPSHLPTNLVCLRTSPPQCWRGCPLRSDARRRGAPPTAGAGGAAGPWAASWRSCCSASRCSRAATTSTS